MVISINQRGLVMVKDSHIRLECLDNVIQESIVLLDVFL